MRILLTVDESENSQRAVSYVGSLLRRTPDVSITLFHVLKPMPRKLMEHGGSENPVIEGRLGAQLRDDQDTWYRAERESECRVLTKAQATLEKAGFDTSRVALKFGHEEDVARNILEEAAAGKYETIVMGRHGSSGIKHIFGGGVTDQVLRDAQDFAIWVV